MWGLLGIIAARGIGGAGATERALGRSIRACAGFVRGHVPELLAASIGALLLATMLLGEDGLELPCFGSEPSPQIERTSRF